LKKDEFIFLTENFTAIQININALGARPWASNRRPTDSGNSSVPDSRLQLATVCTLLTRDVNIALLPQATTPNNTPIQSSDTVMRLLVINYQQKHQRLRMSSHFLKKKQLVTWFLMFVSSIYQKKISREKEIKFFYCIKASSVGFMGYRALLRAGSHFCHVY